MIIKALSSLMYTLLSGLLVFNLPELPQSIVTLMDEVTEYIIIGLQVIKSFIGSTAMGVFAVMLTLVVAMNLAYLTWSIVFWVIRKIPMLNVKE